MGATKKKWRKILWLKNFRKSYFRKGQTYSKELLTEIWAVIIFRNLLKNFFKNFRTNQKTQPKLPYRFPWNLVTSNNSIWPINSQSFKLEAPSVHDFDRGLKIQIGRPCLRAWSLCDVARADWLNGRHTGEWLSRYYHLNLKPRSKSWTEEASRLKLCELMGQRELFEVTKFHVNR